MDHEWAVRSCTGTKRADDFGRLAVCYLDLSDQLKERKNEIQSMYMASRELIKQRDDLANRVAQLEKYCDFTKKIEAIATDIMKAARLVQEDEANGS